MNTSAFLSALRANPALPLVFRTASAAVAPGYHLTEVKRVAYDTMDCGAVSHRWTETQFEIWTPEEREAGRADFMPAGKFLRIVDRVERDLPLEGEAPARIHAALGGGPAALHDVAAASALGGQLVVELTPDRTRCKARERSACLVQPDGTAPETGCCAVPEASSAAAPTGAGCAVAPAGEKRLAPCCA